MTKDLIDIVPLRWLKKESQRKNNHKVNGHHELTVYRQTIKNLYYI